MCKKRKALKKEMKENESFLHTLNFSHVKKIYNKMSMFYSNDKIPFQNLGWKKETQVKIDYNKTEKSIWIAYECSAKNRTQKHTKINWGWFINLWFIPSRIVYIGTKRPYKNQSIKFRTHSGYTGIWKAVENDVKSQIDKLLEQYPDTKEIVIFGWSLGGAMSEFNHEFCDHHYSNRCKITTMTIGAPRIFFGWFKTLKDWIILRKRFSGMIMFQNINDIITVSPSRIFGFEHIVETLKVGSEKFSLIQLFKPKIHHDKKEYDRVINIKLDELIEEQNKSVKK